MYRWTGRQKRDKNKEKELYDELNVSRIIARLLVNRGINNPKEAMNFLHPDLEQLHPPFLMKDMGKAVDIILNAIDGKKKIHIIGDYDQDGNSATVTLMRGLSFLSADVTYSIPHRILDGYGINKNLIDGAIEQGAELIITCDNGIAAFEAAEYALEKEVDLIITDHHEIATQNGKECLPKAKAILNPKQKDCPYPFKQLCGAGVAFKLIQGLFERLDLDLNTIYPLLQFVAMGTVCDVVDLVDENRIFVVEGLRRINMTSEPGLQYLIEESGWTKDVDVYALGFVLGPAINASGRLDSARLATELFLEEDRDIVRSYAKELVALNHQRQKMTEEGYKSALTQMENWDIDTLPIIVLQEESLHESLAGIVAGRIKDHYYRPTIVLTPSEHKNIWKGSGRSIEPYNMYQHLDLLRDDMVKFGGHSMAAGLSIEQDKIKDFMDKLNDNHHLSREDLVPKQAIDLGINLEYLTKPFIDSLNVMKPYGKGNPSPVLASREVSMKSIKIIGKNKNVLKFIFSKDGHEREGIMFYNTDKVIGYLKNRFGEKLEESFKHRGYENIVDIAYVPEINEYMGKTSVQLVLKDIR